MKSRLSCQQLEDRLTPALNVLMSAGSMLVTGTPEATSPLGLAWSPEGWNEEVSVIRTQGDNYEVKDGGISLGTFNVTGGVTLDLDRVDCDVVVDLNGGTLRGNLLVDLGEGDVGSGSHNYVSVVDGAVAGEVKFTGDTGDLSVAVGVPISRTSFLHYGYMTLYKQELSGSAPLTVGQNVKVEAVDNGDGNKADRFQLGGGSLANANVYTNGVRYTTIDGAVKGDAVARANKADLTIGGTGTVNGSARVVTNGLSEDASLYSANLVVTGKVGTNARAESSGTAKATIAATGTVMGNVVVEAANVYEPSRGVSATLDVNGLVGRNVFVQSTGGGPVNTTIAGKVNGNISLQSTNSTGVNLNVTETGQVGRDLLVDSTTPSGRIDIKVAGKVDRNVLLKTGANVTNVDVTGQVGAAFQLTDGAGDLTVRITDPVLKARAVINPGEGDYTLI